MGTPHQSPLYVVTAMLDDWARQGPAIVRWSAVRPPAAPSIAPFATVIDEADAFDPETCARVLPAINRCFTPGEIPAVRRWLAGVDLGGPMSLRCDPVITPLAASEMLALQDPNPYAAQTLWRVRPDLPPGGAASFTLEGIVTLWPWGERVPAARRSGTVRAAKTWHA